MLLITDEQNDSQVFLPTVTTTINSPATVTSVTTSSTPTTSASSYPSTSTAATSSRDDTQGKRKGNNKHSVLSSISIKLTIVKTN